MRRQDNTAIVFGLVLLFILAVAGYVISREAPATHQESVSTVKNKTVTSHATAKKKVVKRHKVTKHHVKPKRRQSTSSNRQVASYTPRQRTHSNYTRDLAECRMLAQRAAGYTPEQAVKGGLIGGAVGAAAGAAIGAVLGHAGKGAAIGAAAGGFGGGTYSAIEAEKRYKKAYARCMRNRGYNVLN